MSVATNPLSAVLAELEPRQVANDAIDRPKWLRARLGGVTATTAKVLHKGSSRDKNDELKKKIEGDDFQGNRYTDWGSYREAHLLEAAAATPYGWLVHAPGNERHLATPDGLRRTWDGFAVVECKTSKYAIPPSSPKFEDYGYLWQILWQMYCAGTDAAVYVWEQHDDDWSRWSQRPMDRPEEWAAYGPTPIHLEVHEIIMTPTLKDELEKMIKASDRFLDRLDKKVAEIRKQRAEVEAAPDPEAEKVDRLQIQSLETQAKLYRRCIDREKALAAEKKAAADAVLELSVKRWGDESGEHVFTPHPEEKPGIDYRIGYTPAGESSTTKPDEDAAREADPKLWEELESKRLAFEAVSDQWKTHLSNHTTTTTKATPPKAPVTEKKGK